MFKEKIKNNKLTADMKRSRSGRNQMFRKDYGDNKFTSEENADVILTHDLPEMYAELIDNEWYWVKGCSKCKDAVNFEESYSYSVCDKHNVCVNCETPRKDLKDIPWGHRDGFICKPCHDEDAKKLRKEAFEKLDDEEIYTNCTDEIICPHCGSENSNDDIHQDEDMQCHVCTGAFRLTVNYTIDYSTKTIGERLLK